MNINVYRYPDANSYVNDKDNYKDVINMHVLYWHSETLLKVYMTIVS